MQLDTSKRLKIGLIGAESTGKSTLAHMLVGRLRTHGVLAQMVAEPGSSLPFSPERFDTDPQAHIYQITRKMELEMLAGMRENVKVVISDRTPLDHAAYLVTRFHNIPAWACAVVKAAEVWAEQYDALYFLRTGGAEYVEDGFRAPAADNDFRAGVDHMLAAMSLASTVEVSGSFRHRSEYVYHHILERFYGASRFQRVQEQVVMWLRSRGWKVDSVRAQGSRSLQRFHPPTDNDDYDLVVVVDGDATYAADVRADWMAHQEHLGNIMQATVDALITPKGMEAYEV